MTAGPPGAPAIVVIQLCFSGNRTEGESYIQAISSWDGGRCMFQDFSERSYLRQQVAIEEVVKGGEGTKWCASPVAVMVHTDPSQVHQERHASEFDRRCHRPNVLALQRDPERM